MLDHDQSKCQSLLGYLSDYVDGELDPELCSEIEQHLEGCHNCHIVVDTLRKTISLYHEILKDPADIPGGVRERLFRTLNLDDYTHH